MPRPYIGVTGFMDAKEVEEIISEVPPDSKYDLMVGVLASQKTMAGEKNKWPNRYPAPEKIRDIFIGDLFALSLVHYNTKNQDSLLDQLLRINAIAGPFFQGFQLNLAWPNPRIIEAYTNICSPGQRIVLQIGSGAFQMMENSPAKLAKKVKEYDVIVDYVLLDPSGGYGIPLVAEEIRPFLAELHSTHFGRMRFGIAGGLSSLTMHLIEPLIAEFPGLSIDAEGRLRDQNDNLNLVTTKAYVREALKMLS